MVIHPKAAKTLGHTISPTLLFQADKLVRGTCHHPWQRKVGFRVHGRKRCNDAIDVRPIILAVIMAASVMEAAGGIDYLVSVAASIIQRNPQQITVVAPLVCYAFTFRAGTGHIFYPLLPIIYETAHDNDIRPERPIAVSTIASQQAITASPVSAAMAAMIALFEPRGFGLPQIMLISIPATLIGVIVAAMVQTRVGKNLQEDPDYQGHLQAGDIYATGPDRHHDGCPCWFNHRDSHVLTPSGGT